MYKLSDIYNADSAPSFASAILAIGASALFSIGLLMILNSHNNAQTKRLEQTIQAVQKSQEDGTDINTALAEIQASNDKKYLDKSATPKQSTNFDTVTVKNDGDIQGGVKVGKDVYATGKIESKGDMIAGGTLTAKGDAIIVGELGASGDITAHQDLIVEGDAQLESATINGDTIIGGSLTVSGDFFFEGALSLDSDLTVGGYVDASGFTIDGEDINDLFQPAGDYVLIGDDISAPTLESDGDTTVGGNLDVTGDTTLGANLDVIGDTTLGGVLDVTGDISGLTLSSVGDTNVGANLDVTGDVAVDGEVDASTIKLGGTDITTMFLQDGDAISGSTLHSDGDTSVDGNLGVAGDAGIFGDLGVSGSVTMGGDITTTTGTISGAILAAGNGKSIYESNLTGPGTQCAANEHIKINQVESGIVTVAVCRLDSVTTGYDYAEKYPSNENLSAGDLVSIDTANAEHIVRSRGLNDDTVIGVISTDPGLTLGEDDPGYPVALSGRVPVKVTDEGGAISAGDYLTSSSTPGFAKKAGLGDKTIGQALSNLSGSSGTVTMFVNVTKGGGASISLVQSAGAITNGSSASLSSLNVSGPSSLSDLTVAGSAVINNLSVTGSTTVANITINGHIIGNDDTRGSVTVPKGTTTVHHDFVSPYSKKPAIVASPTGDPVPYSINPTQSGFDINLSAPAANDTPFDYLVQE